MQVIHQRPANYTEVKTYQEFEDLLTEGHEDFYTEFTLNNGTVKGENAPFDREDAMGYVLVRIMMQDSQFKLYKC